METPTMGRVLKGRSCTASRPRWQFSLRSLLVFVTLFSVVVALSVAAYRELTDPLRPLRQFNRRISRADRIVVRDGGFDCCGPVDGQRILFEVTDPDEIQDVREHLILVGPTSPCLCCGHPGVDWYLGDTRLALTAIHHGRALIAQGFPQQMALSEKSAEWLDDWFQRHGVTIDSVYRRISRPPAKDDRSDGQADERAADAEAEPTTS